MTRAYNTGTIELMPYPEHGEFVIVGVFAVDAERRSLEWRLLESQKTKRLTQFFPELEKRLFPKVLKNLHGDWQGLSKMINEGAKTEALKLQGFDGAQLFKTITRPREGMVRHQIRGTILSKDIDHWLDDAFARMVHRVELDVSCPEEQRLTNDVQELLTEWKVNKAWKKRRIGNDDYHATFPFTYQPEEAEKVARAIKPLFLGQTSATKILDHGDFWLQKVRRLEHFKLAPDMIIFPVERPVNGNTERADNAELVISDLKRSGVKIIERENVSELRELTLFPAGEGTPLFCKQR
jgi:hypothetical protein